VVKRFALRGRADALGARRGFTLIELAIATSILMIGIVSLLSASSQMHSLRKVNRERTLAQNAVRSMAERIHAASQGFSDEPGTWAQNVLATYGPGGSAGNTFAVEGLAPEEGAESVGSIRIGTDETDTDGELGAELGMPRDLDGDGDAVDADVSGIARILPVVLTLRWRGENGVHLMRHGFYVMGY
jgi:prepilin-type N-terminal cleavage/methylation domain-containing protein